MKRVAMERPDKVKKTRKRHTNSKLGCSNCKRRQIKCDEALPICHNCLRRNDACSYLFMPSQEFQQLVGFKNGNGGGVLKELVDFSDTELLLHPENFNIDNINVESKKNLAKLKSNSNDKKKKKIVKVFDYFENSNEINSLEDTDATISEADLISPSIGMNANNFSYTEKVWKKFEDSSDTNSLSTHEYNDPITKITNRKKNINNDHNINQSIDKSHLNGMLSNTSAINLNQSNNFKEKLLSNNGNTESLPDQPYVLINSTLEKAMTPPDIFKNLLDDYMCGSALNITFFNYKGHKRKNVSDIKAYDENDFLNEQTEIYSDDDQSEKDVDKFNGKSKYFDDNTSVYKVSVDNDHDDDNYDGYDYTENEESLPGSRQPYRKFNLNRTSDVDWFEPFYKKVLHVLLCIQTQSISELFKIFGPFDIDAYFEKFYRIQSIFQTLFSLLIQKSALLLISDIIKNTLCKQKSIIPIMSDEIRVRICGVCEHYSVVGLEALKDLINNTYVSNYAKFTNSQREMICGGFILMAVCTSYHYNSGYRQSMSIEQSLQCIKYVGTFSTGTYSIAINENDKKLKDQIHFVRLYSKHILLFSKLITVINYNSRIFDEMYRHLESLKLDHTEDFENKAWASHYINLIIFLEKHAFFLRDFREDGTLLGYDKGYIIRMLNEWYQIMPHDLVNLIYLDKTKNDTDTQPFIILSFTFLALRYYLEALVPGVRSLVRSSFSGTEKLGYDSVSNLLKIYHLITIKEYKVYAIYILRIFIFFLSRLDKLKTIYSNVFIPEFSGFENMETEERCKRLLNNWKYAHFLHEKVRTSFDIFAGTYIDECNYPSINDAHVMVAPERRILFDSTDLMIQDFEKTNSGLFSNDFDSRLNKLTPSDVASALSTINTSNDSLLHTVASNSDDEVNSNTMRNCWKIDQFIKLGQPQFKYNV